MLAWLNLKMLFTRPSTMASKEKNSEITDTKQTHMKCHPNQRRKHHAKLLGVLLIAWQLQ